MTKIYETSNIHPSWLPIAKRFFETPKGIQLHNTIQKAYQHEQIFPLQKDLFNACNATPLNAVTTILLGQDPYHNDGQAHGFCFSVPEHTPIPPSLTNIYKEIESDIGGVHNTNGNLEHWAKQGVLLLNAILTAQAHKPASHRDIGWEDFTDTIIQHISETKEHCVFLLWGAFAQKKIDLIDETKHCVLTSAHPSPLSAHKGFFGNNHFSKTNKYLRTHKKPPIVW